METDNFISGHSNGNIILWDFTSQKELLLYKEHTKTVWDIKNMQTKEFISASADFSVKIWNINSTKSLKTFTHSHTAYCVDILSDCYTNFIAAGYSNRTIIIWNTENGFKNTVIKSDANEFPFRMLCLKNIKPGNMLLYSNYKNIKLLNIDNTQIIQEYTEHSDWINDISRYQSDMFISCSDDKTIRVWNIDNPKSIKVISSHCSIAYNIYALCDIIVAGCSDESLKVIEISNGSLKLSKNIGEDINSFAIVLNSKRLKIVSSGNNKSILVLSNH